MARLRGGVSEEEEDAPPLPVAATRATLPAFFGIALLKGALRAVRADAVLLLLLLLLLLETRKPCVVRDDTIALSMQRRTTRKQRD